MMKIFISFVMTFLWIQLSFGFEGKYKAKNFEEAKKNETTQLQFVVTSTKVGIFSSDVDGYAKEFSYSAEVDSKKNIINNMKVVIPVMSMDTDGEGRDEKLHNLCLSHDKFPTIEVLIPGNLFLNKGKTIEVLGDVTIRGKKKKAVVEIQGDLKDGVLVVSGKSSWSLKEMEIPDPSIAVAKLSDEIRINFKIKHSLK
ncbi:MAG: YceI family protein [Halobacteriovoraceae bacterium]|nr:YceI family protein [Halobacteriovoraceae bacterium]MCB9095524.1 YceI family protein [Halobacteriovoraceae bacterium]